MARKPLLAADLDLPDTLPRAQPGHAVPPPAFHETPAMPAGPAPAPGGIKQAAIATTLYLLPDDHKRLRHLAADRGVAAQSLLLDAIDMLFAAAGEGPVTRWETRRRSR
jgi:hypothetical protein